MPGSSAGAAARLACWFDRLVAYSSPRAEVLSNVWLPAPLKQWNNETGFKGWFARLDSLTLVLGDEF